MSRAQTKSSFDGIIQEMPDVSVDNFERTDRKAYFLSHCHTDHMSGIFSDTLLSHLKKDNVFIYMSEPSAAIVRHQSGVCKDVANYIVPLVIGSTTITIPADEKNRTEEQYITVSLIPAGHCFGSVMFLFKTLYKTILYTGDFRISMNSVCKYAQLHEKDEIIKLDALYVDTTFQNDEHEDFPKRSDSVELVTRYIKKWLSMNDTNQVALHTSARYGYEFVFNKIFEETDQKVYVDEDLWMLYRQFPKLVRGVTNELTNSRIHKCRNRHEGQSHEACFHPDMDKRLQDPKTIFLFIHFSAYKWRGFKMEDKIIEIKKNNRIDVCFATHCSKSELTYFVHYLSPKRVVGFPNVYEMGNVEKDIACKRPSAEKLPKVNAKVGRMVDKDLVREIFED